MDILDGYSTIVIGFIALLYGLLDMLAHAELIQSAFFILIGILAIIFSVSALKSYTNKTYYLVSFSLIVLLGLILIYSALFIPTTNKGHIYFVAVAFIGLLLFYGFSYHRRHKNILRPWNDSW